MSSAEGTQAMTASEARIAALKIRAGADPAAYHVNGELPGAILDQLLDLAAKLG